jgi:replicative DNA helicase
MVTREHFVDLFHRDVWKAIIEYFNKYGTAPKRKHFKKYLIRNITPTEKLKFEEQRKMWVSSISKLYTVSTEDVKPELERLNELYKKRILQKSIVKIVKDYESDNLENILIHMGGTILKCTKYEKAITQGNIVDDVKQHLIIDKQIKKGLIKAIPLGLMGIQESGKGFKIVKFDDYITGGGYYGEMGLIVGETNVGKSFMLSDVAHNVARYANENSVIYTIEMNKIKEERRLYSRITGIPYYKFKRGELDRSDRIKLREFAKWWTDEIGTTLEVVAFDTGNATINDIRNAHTDIENRYGKRFGVAVIDYLNDIKPLGSYVDDKSWSAIGSVSNDMTNWSKNHNNHQGLFVLTANQKKTAQYGKDTTKRGSSQGSALPEHQATWAVGMGQSEEDEIIGRVRVDLFKNRDGEKSVSFYIYPNFAKSRLNSVKRIKDYYGKVKTKEGE